MRELPQMTAFPHPRARVADHRCRRRREAIKAWLVEQLGSKGRTGAELAELARLQLMAASRAARATLAHAERILPLSTADMFGRQPDPV
jgi:hypothetical protein